MMNINEVVNLINEKIRFAYSAYPHKITEDEFVAIHADIKFLNQLAEQIENAPDSFYEDVSLSDICEKRNIVSNTALPPLFSDL